MLSVVEDHGVRAVGDRCGLSHACRFDGLDADRSRWQQAAEQHPRIAESDSNRLISVPWLQRLAPVQGDVVREHDLAVVSTHDALAIGQLDQHVTHDRNPGNARRALEPGTVTGSQPARRRPIRSRPRERELSPGARAAAAPPPTARPGRVAVSRALAYSPTENYFPVGEHVAEGPRVDPSRQRAHPPLVAERRETLAGSRTIAGPFRALGPNLGTQRGHMRFLTSSVPLLITRGDDRNRTGVDGFAGRCVTTPPRRRESEG